MAISDKALQGKVALVTGASRGIGRSIAIALGRRGAKVIVNFLPDSPAEPNVREQQAREVAAEVEAAGGQAAIVGFDVANSAAVTDAIKAIGKDHERLDILVNNAGIAVNGLLMRFSDEQWARTMQINLGGAFHTIRAAATLVMKAKESGRIINIASVVGEMGNGGQAAYAASKAGLIGLTKTTARELASRGVTCNAVAPGYIATDMTAEALPEAARGKLLEQIPLGKIGDAQDVADAVAFLAGPEAAYITGQVLRVNGGMLM
jgi:3-oxoacyl-[acyl-carrier protein] reductase